MWFIATLIIVFSVGFILQPTTNFAKADSGPDTSGPTTQCYLQVTVNFPGAGHLSTGSGYYNYGATVVVTAYTNSGFVFDGWYLDGTYQGKLSSYVLQMNQNYELIAAYSKRPCSLTITVNPQGAATTAPAPGISTYDYGDSVVVTAYPNAGYVFDGWYLDGVYIGSGSRATINMNKDHQLSAYFGGNPSATAAPTPIATPTPTSSPTPIPTVSPTATPTATSSLPSPTIGFACKSSTGYSGFNVQVDGLVTVNGVGLSGSGILLSYSVNAGNSWNDLAYVSTDDNGGFTAVWMPSATGNYLINATWAGDAAYSRASTIVNFAVTPFVQGQSVFSVASNSTLSRFSFNSVTKELSFSVAGTSGTTGYVAVYIPKSLMSDAANLTVLLDGEQIACYTESQTDTWAVSFSYHHSTHNVVFNLDPAIEHTPASPSPTSSPTVEPSPTSSPIIQPTPSASTQPTSSPTNQPSAQTTGGIFENAITYVAIVAVVVIVVLVVALAFVMKKRKT